MSSSAAVVIPKSQAVAVQLARIDPNYFVEYVMRDERTGGVIKQASMHRAWHTMLDEQPRLIIWSHLEGGKTSQISIGRLIWEIGRQPELRVVIVSNTSELAKKIISANAQYIEKSDEVHEVFPNLEPAEPWNTTTLTVRRATIAKDPTIQACGAFGHIAGARIDLLILDDVLDYENTRTPEMRQKLYEWADSTLFGRLSKDARVWIVGNAWHPEDLLHRLASAHGYKAAVYPVMDPVTGEPRWPERWPAERIERAKRDMTAIEFARKMKCVARDDSEARFKREWIEQCLARGMNGTFVYGLENLPDGYRAYTGVDLAAGKKAKNDETCLFTILLHPNGDREVLCIESGKWSGPEIIQRVIDAHRRYHSIVFVESNAAQKYIVDFTANVSAVPVRTFFTTGQNKPDPDFGVESIASEMSNGKWILPCKGGQHAEMQKFINELLFYSPGAHTGDRLMAAWIAREGARIQPRKVQFGKLDLLTR